jgi:hypothetical protein
VRNSLSILALLLATTAACSRAGNDSATAPPAADRTANASDSEYSAIPPELPAPHGRPNRETGPDLDPNMAPGVAFDVRYSFRLEADRVAEMQQEHQRLCARYGPRCRITGMDYRAANEDDVEAMLSFLVDPAIAGQFGRESVRAVNAADGELTESEVSGTDVGSSLKTNAGSLDELRAELARIEARLAARGLRWRERASLEDQRQSLRQQIADLRATAGAQEQALATTPILFRYGSGALAPGPARAATVREATEHAADNFLGGLRALLILFVTVSPWALTAFLLWAGFRFVRRRRPGQVASPEA